jgi:exosome complex exonuclease DIS3/RRP44
MMSSAKDLDDGQKTIYDEHLSSAHISNGIKSGKYLQGKLGISSHNYLEVTAHIQHLTRNNMKQYMRWMRW